MTQFRWWFIGIFVICLFLNVVKPFEFLYNLSYRCDRYCDWVYHIQTVLFILMLACLVALLFCTKRWWFRIATSIVLLILFCFVQFHITLGAGMLPESQSIVKTAPSGAYQAVLYTRGFFDVHPYIVIEGKGRQAQIIYFGRQGTSATFKWLDDRQLEVFATCDHCTPASSKPFILKIKHP